AAGTKIRALACKSGNTNSSIEEAVYNFKAADPSALPSGGVQSSGTVITLSTVTASGQIHYTTDGSTPTCLTPNPITETGTIPAITTNTQVMAIVCRSGYASSNVETFDYQVRAGAPSISPASGTYGDTVAVTLTPGTNGTIHCYTTDNTA